MLEESVVQPLLVTTSALNLATECVRMILKVDLLMSVPLCKSRRIGVVGSDAEKVSHCRCRAKFLHMT